ncbi:MAG: 4-hydroxy-tetrahydrodipicolinate synthase [Bacteriovoracaceae bacterium]
MSEYNLKDYPLFTALITPFNEDCSVDWESLEKLFKQQEQAKNGILILGSTGEALNIDLETRKEILKFTTSKVTSVPIMIGVGGSELKATQDWISWCQAELPKGSFHSFLLVTPLYAKPGRHGQTHWFQNLLDLSQVPCVLYNVPSRTGTSLHFDTVSDLKDHKNFFGLKEASGSVKDFEEYRKRAPHQFLYSGDDALTFEFAKHNVNGLISVASNIWPEKTHLYLDKCLSRSLSDEDKSLWSKACDSLFEASNPTPAKALLNEIGVIKTGVLLAPLNEKDLASTENQQKYHQLISTWNS